VKNSCPKHVDFYSKNKFEKLVHLVGFIIRIYHDARSPERQIRKNYFKTCTGCISRSSEFNIFPSDQHVGSSAPDAPSNACSVCYCLRCKPKSACRDRYILLNYACTVFNEILSVVLSCYMKTYGQTDSQTDTRKLADEAQERQVPL
jgi:hypothetical protein